MTNNNVPAIFAGTTSSRIHYVIAISSVTTWGFKARTVHFELMAALKNGLRRALYLTNVWPEPKSSAAGVRVCQVTN